MNDVVKELVKNELIYYPTSPDDDSDLRVYWRTILRYKWKIFWLSVALTLFSTLMVFSITPTYTATSTLLIEAEQANVLSIDEIMGVDASRSEYYFTQFEILKSKKIAEKVIIKLNLLNQAEFNSSLNPEESIITRVKSWMFSVNQNDSQKLTDTQEKYLLLQSAINLFSVKLTIKPIRKTQLVKISFESEKADLAAKIADAIAQAYIRSYLDSKMLLTNQATSWMNEKMSGLKAKLQQVEATLQLFQERENLVDVEGILGLASAELNELTDQHLKARLRSGQSQSIYNLVQSHAGNMVALERLPEVLDHPSIQDVKRVQVEIERKVAETGKRYGPKHPKMIAVKAELSTVRNSLKAQILNLVSSIESEYQTEAANERLLAKQLNQAKNAFQVLTAKERQHQMLQREVDINRQLYATFFKRLKETTETAGFQAANARVTDVAVIPLFPSNPNKRRVIIQSFIFSLILGVVLAFILEALNNGVRSVDDIESKVGQRLLGLMPLQKQKKGSSLPLRIFTDKKKHAFIEAVRTIRTTLLLSQLEQSGKVIAVTSSVPGEGKTTVSINLAFSLGRMEKVLLIDADLRRPSIAKAFKYSASQPGLSNLIAGTNSLKECIIKDTISGIYVLPVGLIPPNPQQLLTSKRFEKTLQYLSKKFDRIIIDTAPTHAVSDTLLVSKHVDGLIYVVKSDSTRIKTIRTGINRLVQLDVHICGVVVNQVDLDLEASYGEYSGYYDHYGYRENYVSMMIKDALT